ncbi:MAG TPA: TonB family protein [Candidatus Udaeobacter sp.]|nr:TonB family protein [Candidatus Udaeobacter sp.]
MNLRMLLGCWLCVSVFVQMGASAAPTPTQQPSLSPAAAQPAGTTLDQTTSNDAAKVESSVRPAVILVTIFDPKGNLLRTETGFFISADGRVATTARGLEGGANAVAKMSDGGICNVSGILASSKELNLAVLQADTKKIPFLEVNKNGNLAQGTRVVLVGSALAGNDGSARETTIIAEHGNDLELEGTTPASAAGSPVVNDAGELVGIVTSAGQKTVGRSSAALESLLSHITADTRARWAASAEPSPTPHSTPKPRLLYAPAPSFPSGFSRGGVSGTGRFRLSFDAKGNVINAQVVTSTGNPYFDQAAMQTLRQWKSSPSQGWAVTVPVTFQTR